MLISWPEWTTEITDSTVPGEDQLGIEGAAQGYQQEILPGIITVTDHVRYYSFYAWILYRFIFGKDSKRLLKDFKGSYFKRHELALVLSAFTHHSKDQMFSGIVGSGTNNVKVKRFWGTSDSASLDQEYFQNKEGGFGQYYRTVMQAMGILDEPEYPRWVYRLTERGKLLAEAYQSSISSTQYFKDLELNGQLTQLSKADATEYGQVGCMCPDALKTGHDRGLLLDTFFRLTEGQDHANPHVRRRNSLGVALDLVYQAGGEFQRDMLRPALYIGEYAPGVGYQPAVELTDWVNRWQKVEVRHLFTFGIQCLWAAFLLELNSRTDLKREDWQVWVRDRLTEKDWDISIRQLAEKLCSNAGLPGDFDSLLNTTTTDFGLKSGLDEYSLYLKATRNRTNSMVLIQTGIGVLLQLYLRYYPDYIAQDSIWKEVAFRERLPLNEYFHNMEKGLQNPDWLVKDWLNWIYQEYVFEQHERIALEKLRYQEYDTFKFYYDEGIFHWPTGKNTYQEPIRLAGNRLNNCLSMLIDLGLIIENKIGILTLTQEGVDYYDRVLKGLKNANQS